MISLFLLNKWQTSWSIAFSSLQQEWSLWWCQVSVGHIQRHRDTSWMEERSPVNILAERHLEFNCLKCFWWHLAKLGICWLTILDCDSWPREQAKNSTNGGSWNLREREWHLPWQNKGFLEPLVMMWSFIVEGKYMRTFAYQWKPSTSMQLHEENAEALLTVLRDRGQGYKCLCILESRNEGVYSSQEMLSTRNDVVNN